MEKAPKVTVLMPVYNGEKYLREAMDSILQQTFTDFEFLIINDGSTDKSVEIIESYHDERIRLIHNDGNIKLIATLNKGLDLARGEYIARMDCDDISLPKRLKKQVEFMDEHLDVGICGTWVETIGEIEGVIWRYNQNADYLRCQLFFDSPLAHPSVIMRMKSLKQHHLRYSTEYIHVEDWFLWQTSSNYFKLSNIPEVLLHYRILSNSVSRRNKNEQEKSIKEIHGENIKSLKIDYSDTECNLQYAIGKGECKGGLLANYQWFKKLIIANRRIKKYPIIAFEKVVIDRWYFICEKSNEFGLKLFIRVLFSNKLFLNVQMRFLKGLLIGLFKKNIRKI